ncbi:hypothetical protein [Sediminitomix flava]|uniref:Uncharacterized protein n=1 Tax=Sediminitomix flava TaxID=379075 RepID=A0A315Z616_SEDFL|nr:hypothetical protein [Sediminitomix flava]PWJ38659.1 hypothetical protein BC781_107250 [Sediminitomix flava]
MELEESRNKDSEWNPISKNDRQKKFDLRVVVDTKDTLSIDIEKYWGYQMPKLKYTIFNKADSDSSLVQALPVYIFNLDTTKQIYLETQDGRVLMICEAKDDKGKWKPIEYWQYSWCGNSYYDSELKRNECAVIKVLNFGGSFETELRYKLKNYDSVYYSNSFQGSIDINQFTLPKDYQNSRITRKFDSLDYLDFIYFKN